MDQNTATFSLAMRARGVSSSNHLLEAPLHLLLDGWSIDLTSVWCSVSLVQSAANEGSPGSSWQCDRWHQHSATTPMSGEHGVRSHISTSRHVGHVIVQCAEWLVQKIVLKSHKQASYRTHLWLLNYLIIDPQKTYQNRIYCLLRLY